MAARYIGTGLGLQPTEEKNVEVKQEAPPRLPHAQLLSQFREEAKTYHANLANKSHAIHAQIRKLQATQEHKSTKERLDIIARTAPESLSDDDLEKYRLIMRYLNLTTALNLGLNTGFDNTTNGFFYYLDRLVPDNKGVKKPSSDNPEQQLKTDINKLEIRRHENNRKIFRKIMGSELQYNYAVTDDEMLSNIYTTAGYTDEDLKQYEGCRLRAQRQDINESPFLIMYCNYVIDEINQAEQKRPANSDNKDLTAIQTWRAKVVPTLKEKLNKLSQQKNVTEQTLKDFAKKVFCVYRLSNDLLSLSQQTPSDEFKNSELFKNNSEQWTAFLMNQRQRFVALGIKTLDNIVKSSSVYSLDELNALHFDIALTGATINNFSSQFNWDQAMRINLSRGITLEGECIKIMYARILHTKDEHWKKNFMWFVFGGLTLILVGALYPQPGYLKAAEIIMGIAANLFGAYKYLDASGTTALPTSFSAEFPSFWKKNSPMPEAYPKEAKKVNKPPSP